MAGYVRIVSIDRKPGGWTVEQAKTFLQNVERKRAEQYPGRYRIHENGDVVGLIFAIENDEVAWMVSSNLIRGGVDIEAYGSLAGAQQRQSEERWDIEKFVAQQTAMRAAAQPPPRHEQPAPAQEQPSSNGDDPYANERGVAFFLVQRRVFSKPNAEAVIYRLAERHSAWAGEEVGSGFKPVGEDAYWVGLRPMSAAIAFATVLQNAGVTVEHRDTLPNNTRPRLRAVDLNNPAPEIRRHTRPQPPVEDDTAGFPGLHTMVDSVARQKLLPLLRAKGKRPRFGRRSKDES